jgi:hypothetical protein
MALFLANKDTEYILFKPVKVRHVLWLARSVERNSYKWETYGVPWLSNGFLSEPIKKHENTFIQSECLNTVRHGTLKCIYHLHSFYFFKN